MTAKKFALDFYASLNLQEQGQDYGLAFEHAVARMDSGGGAARTPKKHLAAGAVDYVCLLSESGDRFPNTGHQEIKKKKSKKKSKKKPKGEEKQEEAEWVTEDEWTDVEGRRGGGRGLQQNINK